MIIKKRNSKIIACAAALFLLFANLNPGARAALPAAPQSEQTADAGSPVISAAFGKISAGSVFGGLESQKRIIINIQDLHCNPEVQNNIAALISEIDEKYGLDELYSEGAYSDASASWINAVGQDRKKALLDALVNSGRLTGSEYFCALSDGGRIIKGIENYEEYSSNMIRFGRILEKRGHYEEQIRLTGSELLLLGNKYLSADNKKFGRLLKLRKSQKIPEEKYFQKLIKYAETAGADAASYRNVKKYASLHKAGRSLNLKKANAQMNALVSEIKNKLPFSAYKSLAEKTGNFSNLYDFSAYAPSILKETGQTLGSKPELKAFLDYLRLEKEISALDLIDEENRLTRQIRQNFSKDQSELETSFALDFYDYLKDYFSASISPGGYKYFTQNFEKFKNVFEKYAYENVSGGLSVGAEEIKAFYESNFKRDGIFASKIAAAGKMSGKNEKAKETKISSLSGAEISEILKNSKVSVAVTGGFHSEGLQKIFEEQNVSHIVIMPRVSKNQNSNDVYTSLAKLQAKRFEKLAASKSKDLNETSEVLAVKKQKPEISARLAFGAGAIALALGSPDAKLEFKNDVVLAVFNGESVSFVWDEKTRAFLFGGFAAENVNAAQGGKVFTKDVLKNIEKHFEILRKALSFGANRELLFSIMEKSAAFAADEGFFTGYGLAFEIAKNENLRNVINQNPDINASRLACLPELFQQIITQNAEIGELKKQYASNPVISAALNAPEFENFVSLYALLAQAKGGPFYLSANGQASKKPKKIALTALTLGLVTASAFLFFPFPVDTDLENFLAQRKLTIENAPKAGNGYISLDYRNNLYEINERLARGVSSLLKEGSISKEEAEYYKIIKHYQDSDYSSIAKTASDGSKDLRLRLFALLQLKRNESSADGGSNGLEGIIKSLKSKKGTVPDLVEEDIVKRFKRAVKDGSFSVADDFHLKAAAFGTYLVWLSELEGVAGYEKLAKNPDIYEKINKSVIVNNDDKVLANSDFIFSRARKSNVYSMSHEIFHNIFFWLKANANKTDDPRKSYEAMHEFFAYMGEGSLDFVLSGKKYGYYKSEKNFFLFEYNYGFSPQNPQAVGRAMANYEQRVFERLRAEFGISPDWKILAETAADFSIVADYSLSQPEVFRKFNEILIYKICAKYGLNREAVKNIFVSEDKRIFPAASKDVSQDHIFVNPGVYFVTASDGFPRQKKLVSAGWRAFGENVWIEKGTKNGVIVFYSKAPQKEVMKEFLSLIRQDAKIKGSQKTIKRIKMTTGTDLDSAVMSDSSRALSGGISFIPLSLPEKRGEALERRQIFNSGAVGSILSSA
jgi:hypothetical protein